MRFKIFVRRFLRALRKRMLILILMILVSLAAGILCNFRVLDDEYVATSSICTWIHSSSIESEKAIYMDLDYKDIILSKKVADKAAEFVGDDYVDGALIRDMINCSNDKKSPIYKIYVKTNNPQFSITVANAVAKAAAMEINTLTFGNNVNVLDEAYNYEQVFDGRKVQIRNILLFVVGGFVLGVFIILLMASLSTKIESVNDVTLNGEIEILGVIPNFDVE